jgi:hypothetical protein
MWRRYAFTIVFNINNKQLLKMWMYPLTATTSQFFVGGCLGIFWFIATGRRPVIKASVLKSVFPLAVVRSSPLNSCSKNRLTLARPCVLKAPQNCILCTPCSLPWSGAHSIATTVPPCLVYQGKGRTTAVAAAAAAAAFQRARGGGALLNTSGDCVPQ